MPLTSRNLFLQSMQDVATVKHICDRIKDSHFVQIVRKFLSNTIDLNLFIYDVNAEDEHQAEKPAHGAIQKEGVKTIKTREKSGHSKRSYPYCQQ